MPVTLTVTVHVAPAASVPLASATLVPPASAVTVPAAHVVAAFGVVAIVTPEGSVSVSATPESATAPAAVLGMVIVSTDVPPAEIDAGRNALLRAMAARLIVKLAVAVAEFETPCVFVNAFAAIVLV